MKVIVNFTTVLTVAFHLVFQIANGQEDINSVSNLSVNLSSQSAQGKNAFHYLEISPSGNFLTSSEASSVPDLVKYKTKRRSDILKIQDYNLELSAPSPEVFKVPIVGYSPETGMRVGLGFKIFLHPKPRMLQNLPIRPSVVTPSITYGFKNNQLTAALETEIYAIKGWHLSSNFRYNIHEMNYYFGIGKHSSKFNRRPYESNSLRLNGSMVKMFHSGISAGVAFSAQHDTPLEFDKEISPNPDGIQGGWTVGLGPAFQIDKRNNTVYPTSGSSFDAAFYRYGVKKIGDYQYNEVKLDYRKYIPSNLLVKGSGFAFQALFNGTWGGAVPFYKLPYITSDRALRGMWRNLYIDRQIVSIQGEFRSFFSPESYRYGYAVFAGAADGASNFFKSYRPDIKIVYGAGLRMELVPKQRLVLRVDGAFNNKGDVGVYSGLGVSF